MILVLNIINRQKAQWWLIKNNKVIYRLAFGLEFDKDQVLQKLFFLLKKNKISLKQIKSFVLLFQAGSLTQVKVTTAMINALAWQNNATVYADYSFQGEIEESWSKIMAKLAKIKKFKPLKVVYDREPEITISQKKNKFEIIK